MTNAEPCAEFRRRSQTGAFKLDADVLDDGYRGMWQALVAWERDAYERGDPIYPQQLRDVLNGIAGDRPDAMRIFALNTTQRGREEEYR